MVVVILLLMMMAASMCCCMIAAAVIVSKMRRGSAGSAGSTGTAGASNSPPAPTGGGPDASVLASDSMKWGGARPAAGGSVGSVIQTFFTSDNNTPASTNTSASGKLMEPYVSCALPFSFLVEKGGGPFKYGDWLHLKRLEGKLVNGKKHTGWVRIDTYCGDLGDYSYCLKDFNGKKYASVDLFIGPFKKSGQVCNGKGSTTGPAGSGLEFTQVKFGPPPTGKGVATYGLAARGTALCNDVVSACVETTGLAKEVCAAEVRKGQARMSEGTVKDHCFHFIPQYDEQAYGWCFSAQGATKQAKKNGGL